MSENTRAADGYCGLYCGSCPQFLSTEPDSCLGCKSGRNQGWCLTCTYKACARKRGIEFCYLCEKYPCAELNEFAYHPDYPYHQEIFAYMTTIRERGREAWLAEMKKRWSCPSCGREASWWDLSCGDCGAALKGYRKPEKKET